MKKTFIKLITLLSLTALLLAGCGNNAATDAEASKESSVISESVDSATENSTTEESTIKNTEEAAESLTESIEDGINIETIAAELMEEYEIDNEDVEAYILQQLEWITEKSGDDTEEYDRLMGILKEEIVLAKEELEEEANTSSEPEQPKVEIAWDINNLPTDRAWVDDLYSKLVNDDYEAVLEILKDDSIAEKAAPYIYQDFVYDSYSYKLVTSDGKFVGLQLPIDMSTNSGRYAWYSENEETDYGFMHTAYGDKQVNYEYSFMENKWYYSWFDGKTIHHSDNETYELQEGEVLMVWAM